jgi:hypothetical protein
MKKLKLLISILLVVNILLHAQQETKTSAEPIIETFKPSGKLIVDVFGDYYYKVSGDTGITGEYKEKAVGENAFAFRRVNLGYSYNFSEKFTGSIVLENTDGNKLEDDTRAVTMKYAFVEWKNIFPGSTLIIGSQKTPIWEIAEGVWGERCVERTIADFRKHGTAVDVGISIKGNILPKGLLGYNLMIGNGESLKVESNKYKKYYGTVSANLLDGKIPIEVHANYEPVGMNETKALTKVFIGFKTDRFALGSEEIYTINTKNNVTTNAFGWSLFGNIQIVKDKLKAFARYDLYNKDINESEAGLVESFFLVGADFSPIKNVNIVPNLWITSYKPKSDITPDQKADIVARITFRFKI